MDYLIFGLMAFAASFLGNIVVHLITRRLGNGGK